MLKWSISAASLAILLAALMAVALVLVLPQVDLMDTAFHRGTAPLDIKSRALSTPALSAVSLLMLTLSFIKAEKNFDYSPVFDDASASSASVVVSSLRC